jgi:hypothetical protein
VYWDMTFVRREGTCVSTNDKPNLTQLAMSIINKMDWRNAADKKRRFVRFWDG